MPLQVISNKMYVYSLLVVCACVCVCGASKILAMPWAHYSHVNFFSIAARALQDNGHDVTVMVPEIYAEKARKHGVKLLIYSYSPENHPYGALQKDNTDFFNSPLSSVRKGRHMMDALHNLCHEVMSNEKLMENIQKEHFDLVIHDNFIFMDCAYVISYKFDLPFVMMGVYRDPWGAGLSASPAMEPHNFCKYQGNMTTIQRVINTLIYIATSIFQHKIFVGDDFVAQYAPNKPKASIKEISSMAEMHLLTTDTYCFDIPRMAAPNYQFIGSFTGKTKPLPKEFNDIMESAKEGVIVISFGSIVEMRRYLKDYIHLLLEALDRLPQKVIMQYTLEDLDGVRIPDNVLIRSWLPQGDLLAHPNTRLFVGHGGLNGQMEAVYHGVPALTLPFQPEQEGNGRRSESRGHGLMVMWPQASAQDLYQAMHTLMTDPSFKSRVKKCADILKSVPEAKTQLVYWINHVLQHGGDHLKPPGADMPGYQFFMLDVIAILTAIFTAMTLLCFCCTRWICRKLFCKAAKTKTE